MWMPVIKAQGGPELVHYGPVRLEAGEGGRQAGMWFKLLQLPLGTLVLRWGCVVHPDGLPYHSRHPVACGDPSATPVEAASPFACAPPLQASDLVGAGSATPRLAPAALAGQGGAD